MKEGSGVVGWIDGYMYTPLSCDSSTECLDPSGLLCVSLRLEEDKAPERAPKRLRFRPA